jgi:hypothetical protein
MWLGLAHFHNGYSFLTISPNLHDIWPLFLLIPSRYFTAHLVTLFRLLGDGYSLLGSKNSLHGTYIHAGPHYNHAA